MARLYGETISKDVVTQLNLRANVLGTTGLRSANHLRYLNEKTAWIRMISSVDRFESESGTYSNNAAKNFILSGGELKLDGEKLISRRGFNTNLEQGKGRYSYNEQLGIRPEAGITSFNIQYKNTFGTLREASINFTVWTRNDLNLAQDLYLRPGVSVIVEWGNSIYLDNDENVKDTITLPSYKEYFNKNKSSVIADIIRDNKIKNFFNYDGFLGLVTNFNWAFRQDGGYDCSIKAVTKGLVLESLTVMKSKSEVELELKERLQLTYFQGKDGFYYDNSLKDKVDANTSTNQEDLNSKTFLHFFAQDISRNFKPEGIGGSNNYDEPLSYNSFNRTIRSGQAKEIEGFEKQRPPVYFKILKEELGTERTDKEYDRNFLVTGFLAAVEDEKRSAYQFISLRTLLALLNISFGFKNPAGDSLTSFYTGNQNGEIDSIFTDPKFKTFDNHFSLNPLYCIIPNIPSADDFKINDSSVVQLQVGNVHNHIRLTKGPYDSIFNIFVNLQAIVADLDSIFEGEKEPKDANLFDFVKKVLNKINSYLGSINELDLHFDEDIQKWIVIDRAIIVEEIRKNENNIEILDLSGLKSTISNVSLQTSITSDLASQIAISAQGTKSYDANVSLPLVDWNANIKDRFFTPPTLTSPPLLLTPNDKEVNNLAEEKRIREEFTKKVKTAYQDLNNSGTKGGFINFRVQKFKKDIFENIKSDGIIQFQNEVFGKTYNNKKVTSDGLIPINLELSLDGIGGLKIGQVFRVGSVEKPSNILPDIYNKYGFIITGLDSSIENNKWITKLKGITFKFENDPAEISNIPTEDTNIRQQQSTLTIPDNSNLFTS